MAFQQYNAIAYNVSQYNADAFTWVSTLSEGVGSADSYGPSESFKALGDSIASSDAATKAFATAARAEFLFLSDVVTKSILNKGFSEVIRVNDWLKITRINTSWNS